MKSSAAFSASKAVAAGILVLTVPLALWLIPEPEPPKVTDAPVLPSVVNGNTVLEVPTEDVIHTALNTYYAAVNAHDAGRMATLWAAMDEVLLELPGSPPLRGRVAVDAAYRQMLMPGGMNHVEPSRVRMRIMGGRAEVALMETISTTENGQARTHHHVATHVIFKTDSGWLWVAHRRLSEALPTLLPDGGG